MSIAPEKLKDYILRLKTTSIHSVKQAENLSVLLELCRYEHDQADRANNYAMLKNQNSIHSQLKDIKNYKFMCKTIQSRDDSVVVTLFDLLLLLGDYENFLDVLTEASFLQGVIKVYRTTQIRPIKLKTLTFLNRLLNVADTQQKASQTEKQSVVAQVAIELVNRGVPVTHVDDLHSIMS